MDMQINIFPCSLNEPPARVLKFQQMDNWEFVDRELKAKASDTKFQNSSLDYKKENKEGYVDAYKEGIRRMSISNVFVSAALMPTGISISKQPTSISYTS